MPQQSTGHLLFLGDVEIYIRDRYICRAPIANPVMPDGYRCGRSDAMAFDDAAVTAYVARMRFAFAS